MGLCVPDLTSTIPSTTGLIKSFIFILIKKVSGGVWESGGGGGRGREEEGYEIVG